MHLKLFEFLDSYVDPDTLLNWVRKQVREFDDIEIEDISSFRDGRILCAIIHHYRPDLIDYSAIQSNNAAKNNQLAFDILEKEIGELFSFLTFLFLMDSIKL